jgi:hypothetical protein
VMHHDGLTSSSCPSRVEGDGANVPRWVVRGQRTLSVVMGNALLTEDASSTWSVTVVSHCSSRNKHLLM